MAKVGILAKKVIETVSWDSRGILYVHNPQKVKTINGESYTNLLERFNVELKKQSTHVSSLYEKNVMN